MTITIDYEKEGNEAVIISDENSYIWDQIRYFIASECKSKNIDQYIIKLPWYDFLCVKNRLVNFVYGIYHIKVNLSYSAKEHLKKNKKVSFNASLDRIIPTYAEITGRLQKVGFTRNLTEMQKRNVSRLVNLPAGATFSVPGAGKTTEALAYYFLNSQRGDCLLVVAPKNAFEAWNEQMEESVGIKKAFVRLRGGKEKIQELLSDNPKYIIISYQQFILVQDIMRKYIASRNTFVFLDESHRIKGGKQSISSEALVSIADVPYRKLIMSGTPMPQSERDLIPQFNFLYPGKYVDVDNVVEAFQSVFVRTTKSELGLPDIRREVIQLQMGSKQKAFYKLLKHQTATDMLKMSRINRNSIRHLGKSIIKVMQFVSNPALLAKNLDYMFSPELSEALMEEGSVKIDKACEMAREFAEKGEKTIIWTSYVTNVELISERLADLGAVYIHGQVDAGNDDEEDTREWKIKKFKEEKEGTWVLVANPAAASEGISLHTVCHKAIYVDRTFNAAQYLQSEDRIHRYGLEEDTYIYILECMDTIDETIQGRLNAKVEAMSHALNDTSLSIIPDIFSTEDSDNYGGIDISDMDAILRHLNGGEI